MSEMTIVEPQETGIVQHTPESLIALAIGKGIDVDGLERLLQMANDMKDRAAKQDFLAAMAAFQSECPVITKTRAVKEKNNPDKTRYCYAALEDIRAHIKDLLTKHGLSYRWNTQRIEKVSGGSEMHVQCLISHRAGHTETTEMELPIGVPQFMTEAQNRASLITFAKRYTLCNGLGIIVGGEDDDAGPPPAPAKAASHVPANGPQPAPQATAPANGHKPAEQPSNALALLQAASKVGSKTLAEAWNRASTEDREKHANAMAELRKEALRADWWERIGPLFADSYQGPPSPQEVLNTVIIPDIQKLPQADRAIVGKFLESRVLQAGMVIQGGKVSWPS